MFETGLPASSARVYEFLPVNETGQAAGANPVLFALFADLQKGPVPIIAATAVAQGICLFMRKFQLALFHNLRIEICCLPFF